MIKSWILSIFAAAVLFVAAPFLVLQFPYIENWPFTGILYGSLALTLTSFIALKNRNYLKPGASCRLRGIAVTVAVPFGFLLSFSCFSLRQSTEYLMSYSFENAVILNKSRSSNHHYPRIALENTDGRLIMLDIPGQDELWQRLNIGDRVSKEFRSEEIYPVLTTEDYNNSRQ